MSHILSLFWTILSIFSRFCPYFADFSIVKSKCWYIFDRTKNRRKSLDILYNISFIFSKTQKTFLRFFVLLIIYQHFDLTLQKLAKKGQNRPKIDKIIQNNDKNMTYMPKFSKLVLTKKISEVINSK